MIVNAECHKWSKYREYMSVEYSATNWTGTSHLLPSTQGHDGKEDRKIIKQKAREDYSETVSFRHDMTTTLISLIGAVVTYTKSSQSPFKQEVKGESVLFNGTFRGV